MKTLYRFCILGLIVSATLATGHAALSPKSSLIGKFLVSSVKGDVTCISDGRIFELKKGDTLAARGTILRTGAGAHVTIVFSNGTGVYTDEKTNLEVVKFDQEFFAPNNNLRVEPSNSSTVVKLNTGRVVISTPRLVSGTTMVYQTPHAAVGIRGEKILVETSEQQTHVAIIEGLATVNVRDKDGYFVSIGKRLTTGKEAFVKRALGGETNEQVAAVEKTASDPTKGDTAPGAKAADGSASALKAPPLPPVTKEGEAVVLRILGAARVKLPGATQESPLKDGAKLSRGTTISTEESAEVDLQPYEGAVATLRPQTTVFIESIAITTSGTVIKKQSSLLALKAGSIVSTIDPAKRDVNEYSIRTPKGIATAKGTSFVVSVDGDGFSVLGTADTVSFLIPDGTVYAIAAGTVSITSPGGDPQPPVPLAAAVSANPALASLIQAGFSTVAGLVQNNRGGFSPESATNLLTKVANAAASALPSQATAIVTQAINAVSAPSSVTSAAIPAAVAAVTQAVVSAAPTLAPQIAAAAATAAPTRVTVIAAAASKEVPAQAPQIAAAVTLLFAQAEPDGQISPSSIQSAAAVAAAVTTAAPNQAPAIASTVLQALVQVASKSPPLANANAAAVIASATATSAPTQAAPIASAVMKALTQTPTFADASTQVVAQSAGILAASVTSVVPEQAQPVATAVMQLLMEANPNAQPGAIAEISGTLSAAVAQVAPAQADGVFEGVAGASNQSVASLRASAAQYQGQALAISQQVGQINQVASAAVQQGSEATQSVAAGVLLAQDRNASATGPGALVDANSATSIIITQFDPTEINQLTADLNAAQSAQSEVQFNTGPDGKGGSTVIPVFTTPATPPVEFVVSPARKKDKDKDQD